MPTYKKKCCVEGCEDTTSSRHQLPVSKKDILKVWLNRIGNPSLFQYDDKTLSNSYFVCSSHFIKESINGRQLVANSLTSVNLPGFHEEPSFTNSFWNAWQKQQEHSTPDQGDSSQMEHELPEESSSFLLDEPPRSEVISHATSSTRIRRERYHLLKKVNVTRQSHLTPRERELYKVASKFVEKSYKLSRKLTSVEDRLRVAKQLCESATCKKLETSVSPTIYQFLISQIKGYHKKPRGRRFSLDDKVVALSMFKCSPRGYRLLQKLFVLPSRRTLGEVLKKMPFATGLNDKIIEHLRQVVASLTEKEKFCTILFDEVSLQPGLTYLKSKDVIQGFEDFGDVKHLKIADHALVFFAQGLYKNWKQPLTFMFCNAATNSQQLVILIKKIIRAVISTGLIPVATVCDQATQNQAAVNFLMQETRNEYLQQNKEYTGFGFEVDATEIVPIYDYPHLIKCLRNNFLTKDALYTNENGLQCRASWNYIVKLYEMDCGRSGERLCPKLTDAHVYPNNIKKMKVKCCTQALSRSVGLLMGFLAENRISPFEDALGTAEIIIFFDKLFDSFNGATNFSTSPTNLRCKISSLSPHHEFWRSAKVVLNSLRFECPKSKKITKPPTIKNFVHTINATQYLWRKLEMIGYKFLIPRNLNQDAIENFFSLIRSHGVRNVNPTCFQFVASFKALIVNNFMSSTSIASNCENNLDNNGLANFKSFICTQDDHQTCEAEQPIFTTMPEEPDTSSQLITYAKAYVSGYVAQKILKMTGTCNVCFKNFVSCEELPQHQFITLKQNYVKSLVLPHSQFMNLFNKCSEIICKNLPKLCLQNNLSYKLNELIIDIDPGTIKCQQHPNVVQHFRNLLINFIIQSWIKDINRLLQGADSRLRPNMDKVKLLAYNWRSKRK